MKLFGLSVVPINEDVFVANATSAGKAYPLRLNPSPAVSEVEIGRELRRRIYAEWSCG